MKILFYEERHFSPNFHEFTGLKKKFAQKKHFLAFFSQFVSFFSPKLEKKKMSKSVSGYYKTKKKKKKKSGMDH